MKLEKNTFMQGAFIATFGIIICKILGILYVIPFYAIIGERGGALYGYAYNIYSIFLGISQAGLPLAMSKIISEYNTLGYYNIKERTFKIGRKFLSCIGIICFLILFIFADKIGFLIIGNIKGGNTREDVAFVIRLISTAILIIPTLSVYRGYFQGHKFITPTSISQVLEQVTRVLIIIIGSFLMMKVFKMSLRSTVGCAVFAATIGGIVSITYLTIKHKKNKDKFGCKVKEIKEPKTTDKDLMIKIFIYAFPFIMIEIFRSLYNSVDVLTLVKVLVNNIGYSIKDAESIMSVITTWGLKLNMIVISVVSGIMTSLIPNLTASFVQKDITEVKNKINKTFQIIFFFTLPMSIGLSILAKPIWNVFYGQSAYGSLVYQYYVFVAFATCIFSTSVTIAQVLKEYKMVFISLISGLLFKIILNIPFIYGFNKLGLPAFYGSITTSILGFLISSYICVSFVKKKYKINFDESIKQILNIIISVIIMSVILIVLRQIIPMNVNSRMLSIFIVLLYALIGTSIYVLCTYRLKTINTIFGKGAIKKMVSKMRGKR